MEEVAGADAKQLSRVVAVAAAENAVATAAVHVLVAEKEELQGEADQQARNHSGTLA